MIDPTYCYCQDSQEIQPGINQFFFAATIDYFLSFLETYEIGLGSNLDCPVSQFWLSKGSSGLVTRVRVSANPVTSPLSSTVCAHSVRPHRTKWPNWFSVLYRFYENKTIRIQCSIDVPVLWNLLNQKCT